MGVVIDGVGSVTLQATIVGTLLERVARLDSLGGGGAFLLGMMFFLGTGGVDGLVEYEIFVHGPTCCFKMFGIGVRLRGRVLLKFE
jgi:hypothetical protein